MLRSTKKTKAQLEAGYGKPKSASFEFFRIEQFFANRLKESTDHLISEKTYQDLDFDEVFMFVDRTVSKVGQQYLYACPAEVIREANALSEKMSNAGG